MPVAEFDAGKYWKERLRENFDLTGVGFLRRSASFNRWVYRIRTEALDNIFTEYNWPTKGRAVLDIGCGTGYFIDHWLTRGASPVHGVDLAEVSIEKLRTRFKEAEFTFGDITESQLDVRGTFEYVSIFDVLYHIVDDRRFEQAVENLSKLCQDGTKVIITDMFGNRTNEVRKHVRNRSLAEYERIFSKYGFSLLQLSPLFFTLMPPARLSNRIAYWTGTLFWEALTFLARWQLCGNVTGSVLYRVDSWLRKTFKSGPSHHLALFEFSGTSNG